MPRRFVLSIPLASTLLFALASPAAGSARVVPDGFVARLASCLEAGSPTVCTASGLPSQLARRAPACRDGLVPRRLCDASFPSPAPKPPDFAELCRQGLVPEGVCENGPEHFAALSAEEREAGRQRVCAAGLVARRFCEPLERTPEN